MTVSLSPAQEKAVRDELEERADYITDDELRQGTATNDFFDDVQQKLVGRGTKLVVGPRGCGKTHMMRFAQLSCVDQPSYPFAVYVSFNRYYRLEPMLHHKGNAVRLFHVWALANIALATYTALGQFGVEEADGEASLGFSHASLLALVSKLESGTVLDETLQQAADQLSVISVGAALESAMKLCCCRSLKTDQQDEVLLTEN